MREEYEDVTGATRVQTGEEFEEQLREIFSLVIKDSE
jgi:hypothetical protein